MKKVLFLTFFLLGLVYSIVPLYAQTETFEVNPSDNTVISKPYIFPPSSTPGLYTLALFDKNGYGQIAAKLVIDKLDKQGMNQITFLIPGKDIIFLQSVLETFVLEKNCNGYEVMPFKQKLEGANSPSMPPINDFNNCYDNYQARYTSLFSSTKQTPQGLAVTIAYTPGSDLNSQDSVLFLYKTTSYVAKNLLNNKIKFFTPRFASSLDNVGVGFLVKSGLYIKGSGNGFYQYYPNYKALERARNFKNEVSQELNTLSNDITYQGSVRRQEADLAENTSFEALGIYSSFYLALYISEFMWGIVFLIVIMLVNFLIFRLLFPQLTFGKKLLFSFFMTIVFILILALISLLILIFFRSSNIIYSLAK